MWKADEVLIAMVVHQGDEWFVTGCSSDIQRLYDAGFVERAWDIRLDNGHRPATSLKKRLNYEVTEPPSDKEKNVVTKAIAARTGLGFAHNLHNFEHTYALRQTAAFWTEVLIAFAEEDGNLQSINPADFYAVYQGRVLKEISNVKFSRLDPDTIGY